MKRVYIFAQTTSNAAEAIITQMVPSSPRPVKFARGDERKEESIQEGKKRILGEIMARYYGGSHRLLHTFSILHEWHEGEQNTHTRLFPPHS
jgi:hypothetical protein